jgi:hypothetical protein
MGIVTWALTGYIWVTPQDNPEGDSSSLEKDLALYGDIYRR